MKMVYQLHQVVSFVEDREHEFKDLSKVHNPVKAIVERFFEENFNAFINSNGGTIFFGINDTGEVISVKLDRQQMDEISQGLSAVVSTFTPPIEPAFWKLKFVNVSDNSGSSIDGSYVVEVSIEKGPDQLYWTSSTAAFYRDYATTRRMSPQMVIKRVRDQLNTAQASIQTLKSPWNPQDKDIYDTVSAQVRIFEIQIRQLVQKVLEQELGNEWQNRLLESTDSMLKPIAEKWKKRLPTSMFSDETVLDYSDLGDLAQLIMHGSFWSVFGVILRLSKDLGKNNKNLVSDAFSAIIPVRNKIAHIRHYERHELLAAWVAIEKIQVKIFEWYGISRLDSSISPSDSSVSTTREPETSLLSYSSALIEQMMLALVQEQYEPLGALPQFDAVPIAGIENELLSTVLIEKDTSFNSKQQSTATTLGEILNSKNVRVMLLGDAGAGKTTLLKRLAIYLAHISLIDGEISRIPIYVPLIDYEKEKYDLRALMISGLREFGYPIQQDQIDRFLEQGRFFLLFDALNETALIQRDECIRELRHLFRTYTKLDYVITARVGDEYGIQASSLELDAWGEEQIDLYVHRALNVLNSSRSPDLLINELVHDFEQRKAITTPLMLALIVAAYDETGSLATERAPLFRHYVKTLFARDRHRNPSIKLSDLYKEKLLASLAFKVFEAGLVAFDEGFAQDHFGSILVEWGNARLIPSNINAAEILEDFEFGRWFCRVKGGKLRFCFDILFETFVAIALFEDYKSGKLSDDVILNARWEEPVVLLAGLLGNEANRLITRILDLVGPKFAGRCLISAPTVNCRKDVINALRRDLASLEDQRRVDAAGILIFLKDTSAVDDLIAALSDRHRDVAWRAALAIQRTEGYSKSDGLFINILEHPDYPEEAKIAACRALRRSGSLDAISALIRTLSNSNKSVRNNASNQLSQIDDPHITRLLEIALTSEDNPMVKAGALRVLRHKRPQNLEYLAHSYINHQVADVKDEAQLALLTLEDQSVIDACVKTLRTGRPSQRLKTVVHFGLAKLDQSIELLWELLSDSDNQVKREAAKALASIGGKMTITRAIECLQSNDVLMRRAAVRILSNSTEIQAADYLVTLIADPDDGVRKMVSDYLIELGNRALPSLHQMLSKGLKVYTDQQCLPIIEILKSINSRQTILMLCDEVQNETRHNVKLWLLQALQETDPDYTEQAVIGIIPKLLFLLEEQSVPSPLFREICVDLGKWGTLDVRDTLQSLFDLSVGQASINALQRAIGQIESRLAGDSQQIEVVEIEASLSNSDVVQRKLAVERLALLGTPKAIKLLVMVAQRDPHPTVRIAAINGLGILSTEKVLADIASCLVDNNYHVRHTAFYVLAQVNTISSLSILRKACKGQQSEMRKAIVRLAAPRLEMPVIFGLFCELMGDVDPGIQETVVGHIERFNYGLLKPGHIEEIQKFSKNINPFIRRNIIRVVVKAMENSAFMEELIDIIMFGLQDKVLYVRQEALSALELLGRNQPESIGNRILQTLKKSTVSDSKTSGQLIELLAVLTTPGTAGFLLKLLDDRTNPLQTLPCVRAIGLLGLVEGVKPLTRLLSTKISKNERREICSALGRIDSDESTLALIRGIRNPIVSDIAVEALHRRDIRVGVEQLTEMLEESDLQLVALRLLGNTGPNSFVVKRVSDYLKSSDKDIQLAAVTALVTMGSDFVVTPLCQALSSEHQQVRLTAISALGMLRNPRAGDKLIQALIRSYLPELRDERLAIEDAVVSIGARELLSQVVVLLTNDQPFMQQSACRILGRLKYPDAVSNLAVLLDANNPYTRQAAAEALRQIASEEAINVLLDSYENDDWRIRKTAVSAIGEMHVESAVALLSSMLDDKDYEVRLEVVNSLSKISNNSAIEMLALATLDTAYDVRRKVVQVCAQLVMGQGEKATIADILGLLLSDQDVRIRKAAVQELVKMKNSKANQLVALATSDSDVDIQVLAIQSLGQAKEFTNVILLQTAAYSENFDVRHQAEYAIRNIKARVLQGLVETATRQKGSNDDWEEKRKQALRQMHEIEYEWLLQALLEALEKDDRKETYIRLLGWLGSSDQIPTYFATSFKILAKFLENKSRSLQLAAIKAVADAHAVWAVSTLIRLASSPDVLVQQAVIRALSILKAADAIYLIRDRAKADNPFIRAAAIFALGETKDQASLDVCLVALQDPVPQVRQSACSTLSKLGNQTVVPELIAALGDSDTGVQRSAIYSLIRLKAFSAATEILALLNESDLDDKLRYAAIMACGELKIDAAIDYLIQIRQTESGPAYFRASIALGKIKSPEAIRKMILLLPNLELESRGNIIRTIARINLPESYVALSNLLQHLDDQIRYEVVDSINESVDVRDKDFEMDHSAFRTILSDALNDSSEKVRNYALSILQKVNYPDLQNTYTTFLTDPSPSVRKTAADGLGQLSNPLTLLPLQNQLAIEVDPNVLDQILRAIGKIGTKDALATLERLKLSQNVISRMQAIRVLQIEKIEAMLGKIDIKSPEAFLEDTNSHIQQAAIRTIGQQQLVVFLPQLLKLLDRVDTPTLGILIRTLGQLEYARASSALLRFSRHQQPQIRTEIAKALGKLKSEDGLTALKVYLADRVSWVRLAAFDALMQYETRLSQDIVQKHLQVVTPDEAERLMPILSNNLGNGTESCLLEGIRNPNELVRLKYARLLEHLSTSYKEQVIRLFLSDVNSNVVLEAINAAQNAKLTELIPDVRPYTDHDDPRVKASALITLGMLGDSQSISVIRESLIDENPRVVIAAIKSISFLQPNDIIQTLNEVVDHPDQAVCIVAIGVLATHKTKASITVLESYLDHPDKYVVEEAVDAICGFPEELRVHVLVKASSHENHFIREKAIAGISTISDSNALDALIQALHDANSYVRLAAINSLGAAKQPYAVKYCFDLLHEENPRFRVAAIRAISNISPGEYQNDLIQFLKDDNPFVRKATIQALSSSPGRLWLSPIAELAKSDPNKSIRQMAYQTLESMDHVEAQALVGEIQAYHQIFAARLYEPDIQALFSHLQHLEVQLEDADKELGIFTQSLLTDVIPLRLRAAKLANGRQNAALLNVYELMLQDPLASIRELGAKSLAPFAASDSINLYYDKLRKDMGRVKVSFISSLPLDRYDDEMQFFLSDILLDGDKDVVIAGIDFLTKSHAQYAVPLIRSTLQHRSDFVREAAINVLAELRAVDAVVDIAKMVGDPSWYVRQDAVSAIGKIGTAELIVETCRLTLDDSNQYVQLTALQILRDLSEFDSDVIMLLIGRIDDARPAIRNSVANTLRSQFALIQKPDNPLILEEVISKLEKQFGKESDVPTQVEIAHTLVSWNIKKAISFLQGFIFNKNSFLRSQLLEIISPCQEYIDAVRLQETYLSQVNYLSVGTRRDVTWFAASSRPSLCFELLRTASNDKDIAVRINATYGLRRIGNAVIYSILENLARNDVSSQVRQIAKESLRFIQVTPSLEAQQEIKAGYRKQSEQSVEEPLKRLHNLASSGNYMDRLYAVMALSEYPSNAVVNELFDLYLHDDNRLVRSEAAETLQRFASELLTESLSQAKDRYNKRERKTLETLLSKYFAS